MTPEENEDQRAVMPKGCLPDFEGRPVITSCANCQYNEDVSDGPEYGCPYYACTKEGKEHMSNLKSWPFKTPQKCFELHSMYVTDWGKIAAEEELARMGHEPK